MMMHAFASNPPLAAEDFAAIQHPVTIATGDRDSTATVEDALSYFRMLPNGRLCVLPFTGHPFEKMNLELLAAILQTA
jgi:pimeloyl-ACP methyl ester carboxylesterase